MAKDANAVDMFCYQCAMSAPSGCGSSGQTLGTCGKDDTTARLQDLMIFGLKGLAAYREHARELQANTLEIDDVINETLYFTMTNVNFNFDHHIAQLMKVGNAGVKVMDLLSEAHTHKLGVPTPVQVTQNRAEGHAILVSGHNLDMLQKLLVATQDRGVNIYTHSEMLPAHGYPELNKFAHLKGNIGGAWHDQGKLFQQWQGPMVVNTNCIAPLRKDANYLERLYGYKMVGVEGIQEIKDDDFEPLIQQALTLPVVDGFVAESTITTGHHYKTLLTLAPAVVEAVKEGKIRQFFVIAGCDAPGSGGDYYRQMAQALPSDCVILTSSCGKFRFNDLDFGNVPGTSIPRYLDLGQCNDSNGAVHIALALSAALDTPVNELPVSIVLSWMEQKAVIILLALFSLGIQNITIGPKAPQFVNDGILEFLVQQFNLKLTTDAASDLQQLLLPEAKEAKVA
ncbi:hybrid cluster protein [Magnetococcus marinus MC-1]|uniref:Hydroxylamine reductase n=1 Tax=Magnetococcus marinus (strain ATCC BAA-1437 / JCM 17883 / MC-1) TaxID=156889 RepID=A0L8N1_MAGMM|nr:hydroxylamine reductase [Magnetococcus marinus]ABK44324.1 hybrid cluster protein [Magnetococcus marinus MC-1]